MSRKGFRLGAGYAVEEPTVNLTPLIDVVFVILIAFIVVAPLLELDRVELAEASIAALEDKSVSVQEASPVSIHVRSDNVIVVNGQPVTFQQLKDYLIRAKQRYPEAKPQLFHDKKAHFGTYQAIKNAAEEAGFHQMDVVLKPA